MNISLCLCLLLISFSASSQVFMNVYLNDGTVIEVQAADIDSIGYANTNPGGPTLLSLNNPIAVGSTAVIFTVNIVSDGGSEITNKGICWGPDNEPTTADNFIEIGSGSGSFEVTITGLEASTNYKFRAYSINTFGTTYSNQKSTTTLPEFEYSTMEMGLIGNGLNYNGVQHTWDEGSTILLTLPELINEHYTWVFEGVETNTEPDARFKFLEGQSWAGYIIGSDGTLITGSLSNEIVGEQGDFRGTINGAVYNMTLLIHQDTGIPTLVVEPG